MIRRIRVGRDLGIFELGYFTNIIMPLLIFFSLSLFKQEKEKPE